MRGPALALALLLAVPATAQEITAGGAFAGIARGGVTQVTINPGLITLAGKTVTVSVPNIKAGDAVIVTPYSGSLALGVSIGAARSPTNGTVEINLVTSVALGLTLSTMTVQVTYFGP